jgi:hypothetical protein
MKGMRKAYRFFIGDYLGGLDVDGRIIKMVSSLDRFHVVQIGSNCVFIKTILNLWIS